MWLRCKTSTCDALLKRGPSTSKLERRRIDKQLYAGSVKIKAKKEKNSYSRSGHVPSGIIFRLTAEVRRYLRSIKFMMWLTDQMEGI